MRKIYSFLLVFFCFQFGFAQLDTEHWFAPMFQRSGSASDRQNLYFSTNRTIPFPVTIYHNNVQIGTVTISKGNPQKFTIPRQYIITRDNAQLFTPVSMGLEVRGAYPFFANLRFSTYNHAEILTSKGKSGLGTHFYAAMAPIVARHNLFNFMASVMATENNTQVTVSGYSRDVLFSNGNTGANTPTLTFTLQKGQSYIIEGNGMFAQNQNGIIGAKIISDKPVAVTNGNFNGQYATDTNSSDILMDQSVPTEHLGKTFAVVKGNGTIGSNMETPIIIATIDGTQVFVNDEVTPIATLNEGEFFLIPENKYIPHANGHHNLYISTTQNVYVYQLLSGSTASLLSAATGGFNFIPALSCYLPKAIDEVGMIQENEIVTNNNPAGLLNVPTRLNIVTETGAVVQLNGTALPANTGPYPMVGNPNWVTYSVPNVTGNIVVNSTKAVTAGIIAGSDAVGYGGYFAGFNTQPRIAVTGTCFPNASISVVSGSYDGYQWLLNGNPIPGANQITYTPTVPGYYSVEVTNGTCEPKVSDVVKIEKCMVNSTSVLDVCKEVTIVPALSSASIPQALNVNSVAVTVPPTRGIVSIQPITGEITYTANANAIGGTDTFTYSFCGNHPDFPECETVTVTIRLHNFSTQNQTLTSCLVNGQATYDLTTAVVTAATGVTYDYYPTLIDAQNENPATRIANPMAYVITNPTSVFVVVKNVFGCKEIAEIQLQIVPGPVVQDYNGSYCSATIGGAVLLDLGTLTNQIVTNPANYQVRYYANLADANAGNNNTLPNPFIFAITTTIYIRVDAQNGCPPVIKPVVLNVPQSVPLQSIFVNKTVCDDNEDGIKEVNLDAYISSFTNQAGVTATYFTDLDDAMNNVNPISNPVTVNGIDTFFVRFSSDGFCPSVGTITIAVQAAKFSANLQDVEICANQTTVLDVGEGFDAVLWSTGATTNSITVGVGTYTVTLTHRGCSVTQTVTVSAIPQPVITGIDINEKTVTIHVEGGTPPYQYSLNGVLWQDSNVFTNVPRGIYTVYVKDESGCGIVEAEFEIINLINAISPNYDGKNDEINYSEILKKENPVFKIFDRYGAQVFEGTPANRFTWNGKIALNRHVHTDTYWYILEWTETNRLIPRRIKFSSWLLVKNVLGDVLEERNK